MIRDAVIHHRRGHIADRPGTGSGHGSFAEKPLRGADHESALDSLIIAVHEEGGLRLGIVDL